MRQFSPSDEVSWSPRFGDGSDGAKTVAASADYDGANAGLVGSYAVDPLQPHPTLTVDNPSTFANGDLVMVHQSRGMASATTGDWELNMIRAGGGTTALELEFPLQNTYVDDGGNHQAQILELKQWSSLTVNASQSLLAPLWNGNIGGIVAFFVSGTMTLTGFVSASGKGYGGGYGTHNGIAYQGEGSKGNIAQVSPSSNNSNGSGGGGGAESIGSGWGGEAFQTDPTLKTRLGFGGGGGGCAGQGGTGGTGGRGGGVVAIFPKTIATITGGISNAGGAGTNPLGGAGAGGPIVVKTQSGDIGTGLVVAGGGARGTFESNSDAGGSGGGAVAGNYGHAHTTGPEGAIHFEYNTITGTSTPTYNGLQSELFSDFYAHEGIFDSPKAALAQEKYKRQMKVAEI